ncbi:MAG TPA: prolipoprotein diacylglyceryl transferase [Bacilli bacterium]|nr:prolipoprotein diacylglyceryl transferase [Bacilli bacterium]
MNPILLDLDFIIVRWYSVFILVAVLLGISLAIMEAKKFKISTDFIFNLSFWTIMFAYIGARLYYVIFNWSYYSQNFWEVFQVWKGGLAIHGGIIFGLLTILIYTKKYQVRTLKFTDIVVPGVILGQAIGRWGNFFNSEAHGAATTLEFLQKLKIPNFIIEGMNIGGIYYQPTFLYESLWCLLGFIILVIVRRIKYIKVGQITSLYLMWYSLGRFFIEATRTDSLMLGSFKVAQIISVVLFIAGLVIFVICGQKGSKLENLYNEVGNEEDIRF